MNRVEQYINAKSEYERMMSDIRSKYVSPPSLTIDDTILAELSTNGDICVNYQLSKDNALAVANWIISMYNDDIPIDTGISIR